MPCPVLFNVIVWLSSLIVPFTAVVLKLNWLDAGGGVAAAAAAGPAAEPPLPQIPLHPVVVVGALTVMVLLPEHSTVFAVAESSELKLYVVVDVGSTSRVAPDPMEVPEQLAASNQSIVYGDVPPDHEDESVMVWPESIVGFVGVGAAGVVSAGFMVKVGE